MACAALAIVLVYAQVEATEVAGGYALSCGNGSVQVGGRDGRLTFRGSGGGTIGEAVLWRIGLADGAVVSSGDAAIEWSREGAALVGTGSTPGLRVRASLTPEEGSVEVGLTVESTGPTVLWAQSPGPLRFSDTAVRRVIHPSDGNLGVGLELLPGFFQEQSSAGARAWTGEASGPEGYRRLLGGDAVMRENNDPPVRLAVTEAGRALLGDAAADALSGATAVVNRPPSAEVGATALVTSEHGAWLALKRMGEGTLLWVGGAVWQAQKAAVRTAIPAALRGLSGAAPPAERQVAVIQISGQSGGGGWASVSPAEWQSELRARGFEPVVIGSLVELASAVTGDDRPWAILNPYGEWTPVPEGIEMFAWLDAIREFVQAGGVWVETGGYPFFYRMVPLRALRLEMPYPAGFADFQHVETNGGSLSWYRVAPRRHGPWEAAGDPTLVFVPGRLGCGRDEEGPFLSRRYETHVVSGEEWRAPLTRVLFERGAFEALDQYAVSNELGRPLAAKMRPELLEPFRRSVLVYYGGSARAMIDDLDRLPSPCVLHTASYLKGGFDKEYPDHLPPSPSWGTAEDLAELLRACGERGILFMPYTNPTWWCDEPRGPTFLAAGEAPLARSLTGDLYPEAYAANRGWTITFWHEAVRAANERTRTQFTQEFPVAVLFQDQCGARTWVYDTNPASPSPLAYTEGLISMVEEDSAIVPLSTESGWDRILAFESQFCGMTWRVVPTEGGPEWVRPFSDDYPPSAFRPFPLAQALGHESVAMIHHDLGQFVTNDEVLAWTVGLGYGLSYRIGPGALDRPETRAWIEWLDEIQKTVCAPMIGEPLRAWEVLGGDGRAPVFRAVYGDVTVTANTTEEPFGMDAELAIGPHGFLAEGDGVLAGAVTRADQKAWFSWSRGAAGARLVVFGPERTQVEVPLPEWVEEPPAGVVRDGWLTVETGSAPGVVRVAMPEPLREAAPADWPEHRRPSRIGVVVLPDAVSPVWAVIGPQEWLEALRSSRLTQELGLRVEELRPEELEAALTAPEEWFAIVNPYGEVFPVPPGASAAEALEQIRGYVLNGGIWWETGGYSFYSGAGAERLDSGGLERLGVWVTSGEVEAPPTSLAATEAGEGWLTRETLEALQRTPAVANRTAGAGGQPHLDLVGSTSGGYVAGYRLEGWGWLWRLGGMNPPREVAVPIVVDVLARLYEEPWPEPARDARRYLWEYPARPVD